MPDLTKPAVAWNLVWDADWVTAVAWLGASRRVAAGNNLGQILLWELPDKPGGAVPMLSLERIETMNRRALNVAFPLLTAGLLVGTLLLSQGHVAGDNWLSLKVLTTAALWVVFLVLLYLRYGGHVPARRLALLSIAAFAILLVALVAAHPFAEGGAK